MELGTHVEALFDDIALFTHMFMQLEVHYLPFDEFITLFIAHTYHIFPL